MKETDMSEEVEPSNEEKSPGTVQDWKGAFAGLVVLLIVLITIGAFITATVVWLRWLF
jgi:hypothetical protein